MESPALDAAGVDVALEDAAAAAAAVAASTDAVFELLDLVGVAGSVSTTSAVVAEAWKHEHALVMSALGYWLM